MFFSGLFRFDKDSNLQLGYDSENKELTGATNTDSEGNVTDLLSGGGGAGGEFKIANITWENLPETFDNYDTKSAVLWVKTEDGFDDYPGVMEFAELLLVWDDEWFKSSKAIVTTKQPENVGDPAIWLQPYTNYDFSVVSGDAFTWERGVILYGDCTLTISSAE